MIQISTENKAKNNRKKMMIFLISYGGTPAPIAP